MNKAAFIEGVCKGVGIRVVRAFVDVRTANGVIRKPGGYGWARVIGEGEGVVLERSATTYQSAERAYAAAHHYYNLRSA